MAKEMSIDEQRAACGRFMGWHFFQSESCTKGEVWPAQWRKGSKKVMGDFIMYYDNYQPDADTPEGREQANDIWEKLTNEYGWHLSNTDCSYLGRYRFGITSKQREGGSYPTLADETTKTWNSALVSAVANLQTEIDKNG